MPTPTMTLPISDLFPRQPDYGAMTGPDEWSLPLIIADLWVTGDYEDRKWIDQLLGTSRREEERPDFGKDMIEGYLDTRFNIFQKSENN